MTTPRDALRAVRSPRTSLLPFAFALCLLPWIASLDAAAGAQPAPPQLTAPVNDFANVIDASSAGELDRRIRALQAASGDVVVVATVPTFKPYGDINEFAVKMFENGGRGIGARGKDNGILILIAVEDRAIKIEVGYDLEQFVTDGYAGETIRTVIAPEFRSGNYGAGLLAGATRIINRIADGRGVTLDNVPQARPAARGGDGTVSWLPIVIIILLFILFSRGGGGPRGRRRVWGGGPWSGWNSGVGPFGGGGFGGGFGGFGGGGFGGGGGGGFGGFGGGRSGGGGASGSW